MKCTASLPPRPLPFALVFRPCCWIEVWFAAPVTWKIPSQAHSFIKRQWVMCWVRANNLVSLCATQSHIKWIRRCSSIWYGYHSHCMWMSTKNLCLGLHNKNAANCAPDMQYSFGLNQPISSNRSAMFILPLSLNRYVFLLCLNSFASDLLQPRNFESFGRPVRLP